MICRHIPVVSGCILMRVAHVNFVPNGLTGVVKKLKHQAETAKEIGLPIDFFLVNDDSANPASALIHRRFERKSGWRRQLLREHTFHKTGHIEQMIPLRDYDAVVMRYGGNYTRAGGFLRRHGHKLITEHHTKEFNEMLLYRGWLLKWVLAFVEKLTAPQFLNQVAGIIGVTDEIRRYELRISGPKPSTVIGNGIRVSETTFTGFRPFDGKTLHLVFVASDFTPWLALNRLLEGMSAYRGPETIVLHLIGRLDPENQQRLTEWRAPYSEVKQHGSLHGDSLNKVMASATMGVSSLGLYNCQLNEACPLKSREYISRGLPLVMGYRDPDIHADTPFVLVVPNDPTPLDCSWLVGFARKVSQHTGLAEQMREFAERELDWKVKLRCLHEFAAQVLAQKPT